MEFRHVYAINVTLEKFKNMNVKTNALQRLQVTSSCLVTTMIFSKSRNRLLTTAMQFIFLYLRKRNHYSMAYIVFSNGSESCLYVSKRRKIKLTLVSPFLEKVSDPQAICFFL